MLMSIDEATLSEHGVEIAVQGYIEDLQRREIEIPVPLKRFVEKDKGIFIPSIEDYLALPTALRKNIESNYITSAQAETAFVYQRSAYKNSSS